MIGTFTYKLGDLRVLKHPESTCSDSLHKPLVDFNGFSNPLQVSWQVAEHSLMGGGDEGVVVLDTCHSHVCIGPEDVFVG